jgi:hypothetical protein
LHSAVKQEKMLRLLISSGQPNLEESVGNATILNGRDDAIIAKQKTLA